MRLTGLTTHGFRNLSPEPVFFGAGITLVTGENAQGKTNLLEAVALVCGQRSFRRTSPSEMAADGEAFAIEASFSRDDGDRDEPAETLRVEWSRPGGRRFERAGKRLTFREASRLAPAVFFAPEHRDVIVGLPSARRRFLDRLALHCRPTAGEDLARFEKALAARNALLARARATEPAADELETWTEEFVCAAGEVRRHRREALRQWWEVFEPLAAQAGPEYQEVRADYQAAEESTDHLRAACDRLSGIERRRGHSLAGPHRDDLLWSRRGRPLSGQASAGEIHRLVALAKLAQWQAVARATQSRPLLAIDEFDAGLAAGWVQKLLDALPEAETILLTSVAEPARYGKRIDHVLEVRAGRVLGRPRAVGGQEIQNQNRA